MSLNIMRALFVKALTGLHTPFSQSSKIQIETDQIIGKKNILKRKQELCFIFYSIKIGFKCLKSGMIGW